MPAMDAMHIPMTLVVFVLAGAVKGITGMGLPTVAMSLLGLWLLPAQAAALLVVPTLLTNLAQCRGPHLRVLAARLWPGWVALALATVFTPVPGGAEAALLARRSLGTVLVLYGLWGLWRPVVPDLSRHGAWLTAVVGVATGVVTAFTAVFVLPWVPYLQALRLDKDAMVQALGLSFTVSTLALAWRLGMAGPVVWGTASAGWALGAALAGAFIGLWLGTLLRGLLAGPAFQKALCLVFIALGAVNLLRH